jgi:DNA invertase Pin-like site-specific DNA recombinase
LGGAPSRTPAAFFFARAAFVFSEIFTEPYLDSLGPFGDVIVSMLATIAAQDLIKISENTKAALAKKKAAGVRLGAPPKSSDLIEQVRRLKGGVPLTKPSHGP